MTEEQIDAMTAQAAASVNKLIDRTVGDALLDPEANLAETIVKIFSAVIAANESVNTDLEISNVGTLLVLAYVMDILEEG